MSLGVARDILGWMPVADRAVKSPEVSIVSVAPPRSGYQAFRPAKRKKASRFGPVDGANTYDMQFRAFGVARHVS